MKNKIKLISIIIAVIIIGIIIYSFYSNSKKQYSIEEIKQIEYFLYQKDNLYGVINKKGEVIIEPKYEMIQIPNPSKPVFICMNEYNHETGEYKTIVLNSENREIFSEFEKVQAIPINSSTNQIPYEKSILQYKQEDKYGLIDFEGKKITKPVYEEIKSIENKEGTLAVKQNEKYGAINMKGTVIVKPQYDSITADNYYSEKSEYNKAGFIVSNKTEQGYRYGYIDSKGKMLLKTEFTQIDRVTEILDENNIYLIAYENGRAGIRKNKKEILKSEYELIEYNEGIQLFYVQRNEKQGVVNAQGKWILPIDYDNISFAGKCINAQKESNIYQFDEKGNKKENTEFISINPTEDMQYSITINKEDQYGAINKSGETIIKNQYSYLEFIKDGYFMATKDGKTGIIDKTGKSVIDLQYDSMMKIPDTNIIQATSIENDRIDIIDNNMKKVTSLENAIIKVMPSYIMLYSENEVEYYNYNGEKVDNKDVFKNKSLLAKKENDKWGFVDKNGEVKIPYEYDMVTELNENGFAGIKKGENWGVINSNGEIIQEPIYKIKWLQPQFIGKYYLVDLWYGEAFYSDDII